MSDTWVESSGEISLQIPNTLKQKLFCWVSSLSEFLRDCVYCSVQWYLHMYAMHWNQKMQMRLQKAVALPFLVLIRLFVSTEEMEIKMMSSGQHRQLLAVIVCEKKLITFVIYWVIFVRLTFDSSSLMALGWNQTTLAHRNVSNKPCCTVGILKTKVFLVLMNWC